MENVSIIRTYEMQLWNKNHFVENATEIMQYVLKNAVNLLVA